jgi:predicted transcriptional regulator
MSDSISFRLPPELRREFNRFCKRQKRPASEVAREALKRYMLTEDLRQLRLKLRPYAEARGMVADEDFFRAVS